MIDRQEMLIRPRMLASLVFRPEFAAVKQLLSDNLTRGLACLLAFFRMVIMTQKVNGKDFPIVCQLSPLDDPKRCSRFCCTLPSGTNNDQLEYGLRPNCRAKTASTERDTLRVYVLYSAFHAANAVVVMKTPLGGDAKRGSREQSEEKTARMSERQTKTNNNISKASKRTRAAAIFLCMIVMHR